MTALVIRVDLAAARHVLPRQQTWRQVWRAEDPLLCPLSPGAEWCDYQKTEPATTAPKTTALNSMDVVYLRSGEPPV